MHAELARQGVHCGRKRVARLMREHHQVGVHNRRRWRTTRGGTTGGSAAGRAAAVVGADLVRRHFDPSGPNQLWAADVTQFRTGEGWLHLAAWIDRIYRGAGATSCIVRLLQIVIVAWI